MKESKILVSTPGAYLQQHATGAAFRLSDCGLVIFDEVHHVVKRHPYRKVARILQGLNLSDRPRVLGLSASLTYSISPGAHVSRACFEGMFREHVSNSMHVSFSIAMADPLFLFTKNVCGCLKYSPQEGREGSASSQVQGLHGHLALEFCSLARDHLIMIRWAD
jgi:hypothetical protein